MKDYTPQNTASGLTAKIDALVKHLAEETDSARVSEKMQAFLTTCARFHHYSLRNLMLIWIQRPDASQVAGYQTWLKLHRYVKKGEKGIAILAPCTYKKTQPDEQTGQDKESSQLFFKVAYVFDVSQTDGEELPTAPTWSDPEQNEELQNRLLAFAASKHINVLRQQPDKPGSKGCSSGGLIMLAPDAGTMTLIHELAHELLHHGDAQSIDRETEEIEAESVAYVVATAAGMQPSEAAANYLALWQGDQKKITARLARIQAAANEILNFVLPDPLPEATA